jgi:UDP-N-acetylmuramate--alanine ligase
MTVKNFSMNLQSYRHVHCIGVGGIGMSGVAKFLHVNGVSVSGSDAKSSQIIDDLIALGIPVSIGHDISNVSSETDLVVYTEAATEENIERIEASHRDIQQMGHFDFLGALSKDYRTICVTGTNGKSTTTAMTAKIFIDAGLDPTVFVGSIVPDWELGNVRIGEGNILIVEGDEYKQKMVKLWPEGTVITNIEADHLDVYRDLQHIIDTFQEIALKTTGSVFVNRDDVNSQKISGTNLKQYDVSAIEGVTLGVPGAFNRMNASAAAVVAREFGIGDDIIAKSLSSFAGIWRRFERVGTFHGALIISDYGHHPTAIRATLQGAREFFPKNRIVLLFEPHQHSRTKELFNEFAESFGGADILVLSEIYGVLGRTDERDESVTSKLLLDAAMASNYAPKEGHYVANLIEAEAKLREIVQEGDVVIVMGAGDVDVVARNLVNFS